MNTIVNFGMGGLIVVTLFTAGCQTTHDAGQHAVACPGCESVQMLAYHPNAEISSEDAMRFHKCEDCTGEMASFLTSGTWEHACSICQETPYHFQVKK